MSSNAKSAKLKDFMNGEITVRVMVVVVAFIAVLYMAASNWSWYVDNLGDSVKHPKWASPVSNGILWLVWFVISAFVWHIHQTKHKQIAKMDLVYPALLIMVFIMFTLFFEQRHFGAAKWAGVIAIVIMSYIIYEGLVTSGYVTGLLLINYAILLYTVAQIWHASRNEQVVKSDERKPQQSCAPRQNCGVGTPWWA
jgi:tryptophan-rich sensory protein